MSTPLTPRWILRMLAAFSLLTALGACGHSPPSGAPLPAAEVARSAEVVAAGETVLTGTLVHKSWSKTMESWEAGGSDYFVLEIGADTVVLQLDGPVGGSALLPLDGRAVELRGRMVEGKVPTVDPMSQYPMGMDGQPLPTGGGLLVTAVRALD